MRTTICITFLSLAMLAVAGSSFSADFWRNASDPGISTSNDCGYVSNLVGTPKIRRSFNAATDTFSVLYVADRLRSGDEIEVPEGGRLEWISGSNIVVVAGSGARVRLDGMRRFTDEMGRPAARLDMRLLAGEVRTQVRANDERPEAVMLSLSDVDFLLRQGDVVMMAGESWRAAVLGGSLAARYHRAGVAGAPFEVAEGVSADGPSVLADEGMAAIRQRLPFSFEDLRAALPPLPAITRMLEAP